MLGFNITWARWHSPCRDVSVIDTFVAVSVCYFFPSENIDASGFQSGTLNRLRRWQQVQPTPHNELVTIDSLVGGAAINFDDYVVPDVVEWSSVTFRNIHKNDVWIGGWNGWKGRRTRCSGVESHWKCPLHVLTRGMWKKNIWRKKNQLQKSFASLKIKRNDYIRLHWVSVQFLSLALSALKKA